MSEDQKSHASFVVMTSEGMFETRVLPDNGRVAFTLTDKSGVRTQYFRADITDGRIGELESGSLKGDDEAER